MGGITIFHFTIQSVRKWHDKITSPQIQGLFSLQSHFLGTFLLGKAPLQLGGLIYEINDQFGS